VTSVLPGAMVQGLVLDVGNEGINLQLLGFFDGTADRIHLRKRGSPAKVGQKVKGRVLYQYSTEPPRFAVALSEHLADLDEQRVSNEDSDEARPLKEVYPVGQVLESVKVTKIEPERGVYLEVAPGVEGFSHVRPIALGGEPNSHGFRRYPTCQTNISPASLRQGLTKSTHTTAPA
jgi:rRNA biogenesis protein RRP5